MPRIRLIHWNAAEAEERAQWLQSEGYEVVWKPLEGPAGLRELRDDPPDAVVIDLSRIPSQGRDVGAAIRRYKDTRRVPLVFVDGDPDKVEGARKLLPDATFTTWARARRAVRTAIQRPPEEPVAPCAMAGYSGTPLPKKLGIVPDMTLALIGAPEGFESTLGTLPDRVRIVRRSSPKADLSIWFVRRRRDLERRIDGMAERIGTRGLWIAWPKRASGVATDVTQTEVRRVGLAAGLVDYKVAAIDETWSGLRFTRRRSSESS
ncbi:MAG: hypothetical protein QGI83_02180 [Candidatus Latescibacteria bacterium]|jgi:CheY-like chemotaxis protein|nr:hypothetical protein [Candidatus Latescibacterota bacterium]